VVPRQHEIEVSEKRPGRAGARGIWFVTLLIALGLLALHAYRYHPFFVDDAFISLRYAERLIEGHGLTWTDGERVEGYSNLLWVLACAVLGLLGIDLIDAARILGFLGTGAAIAALIWCHRPRGFRDSLPALAGSLGMALAAPLAVWTVGGLEQPLVVGLLAWALVLMLPLIERTSATPPSISEILWPGLLFGLLCWTRPDGPLFIASACGTLLVAGRLRGPGWRLALWLALPSVLFISLQLAFRLGYYGDWVPNTAHAKLAFTSHRFATGLGYLWGGLVPLAGLAIPALGQLLTAALVRTERHRTLLWLAPLAVWSTWVIAIGGDVFLGWRHGVVVIVLLAFLAADFWRTLSDRTQGKGMIAVWLVAAVSLVILGDTQWLGNRYHKRVDWALMRARNGQTLGRLLAGRQGDAAG
jgi:arabinofuranosyltransferase